jgi:hypothetical protein
MNNEDRDPKRAPLAAAPPNKMDEPEGFRLAVMLLIALTIAIVVILFVHEFGRNR